MSEVDQPSREPSVGSGQYSAAGPVPAANVLADYMRLILLHAPTYSGEANTMPFQEWEARNLGWMRTLWILEEYRADLAQTLLRGPALYYWQERENRVGHELS